MKNVRNSMDLDALAVTYLRYHKEKRTEDSWARDRVWEVVRDEPDVALKLTLLLSKKAGEDDATLAYVAAGPLEDLLKLRSLLDEHRGQDTFRCSRGCSLRRS